jgi:type II secretory pathway pseudopilin PulG
MNNCLKEEKGITLIESMLALLILLIGLLTMAQILTMSIVASKNYGRDAGKTTAFARVQMEELAGLPLSDARLTAGEYEEDLSENGIPGVGNAMYTRRWQIIDDGNLKKIIVSVTSNKSFQYGTPPSTTMVTEIAQ